MALNSLFCPDVPLSNYSLTHCTTLYIAELRCKISEPYRTTAIFKRPTAQRGDDSKSSLGLRVAIWVQHTFGYIHLLLHIQPIIPRANARRSILVQARTGASFVRETGDGRLMRLLRESTCCTQWGTRLRHWRLAKQLAAQGGPVE